MVPIMGLKFGCSYVCMHEKMSHSHIVSFWEIPTKKFGCSQGVSHLESKILVLPTKSVVSSDIVSINPKFLIDA